MRYLFLKVTNLLELPKQNRAHFVLGFVFYPLSCKIPFGGSDAQVHRRASGSDRHLHGLRHTDHLHGVLCHQRCTRLLAGSRRDRHVVHATFRVSQITWRLVISTLEQPFRSGWSEKA